MKTEITPDKQQEAPMGLIWGLSIAQTECRDVAIAPVELEGFGNSYILKNLPKTIADIDMVVASYGFNDKLFRVAGISRNYDNDPAGYALRGRYGEISALLEQKYGCGTPTHQLEWLEDNDFLLGIHAGRSRWFTVYKNPAVLVTLLITAQNSDSGYWQIVFENNALAKDVVARQQLSDAEAL